MVTTLIAYAAGTQEMLDVCLASLARHNSGAENKLVVITDGIGHFEACDVIRPYNAEVFAYDIGKMTNGSAMHGMLLDMAVKDVTSEYILSLDSDCFPVAENWLSDLLGFMDNGATLAGILWPWTPPPADLDSVTIEYRIRQNHCWNNTQVVCQLVRKSFLVANNLKYVDGDDTGFAITERARKLGMKIKGWKPTRCAKPSTYDFDPELNRHVCMIFGDKIYHQGGSTRKNQGANIDPQGLFDKARERVFAEKGAEWIFQDDNNHEYEYDREEAVAQFKMQCMFDDMRRYLQTHDSLFNQ